MRTEEDLIQLVKQNKSIIEHLVTLGVIPTKGSICRCMNIGKSNYAKHLIQAWTIWMEYHLNPWDADIVKRVLRTKAEPGMTLQESRKLDYQKIIHVCQERIRQIDEGYEF